MLLAGQPSTYIDRTPRISKKAATLYPLIRSIALLRTNTWRESVELVLVDPNGSKNQVFLLSKKMTWKEIGNLS